VSTGRPTVLVIHDDGDALDLLTRLFEAASFDVVTAVAGYRAQAHLEGDRPIHVVVAPWDPTRTVGGEVYRWALQKRYDLRDQFVFIASEVTTEFDRLVAGRCLAVSMARPADVVRVAVAAIKRRETLETARDAAVADTPGAPRLLLADDDPTLLHVMADLLGDAGFSVTRVETGNAAIGILADHTFDAIITDWHMDDGSGADVYRWIAGTKPWLRERVVFLSGEEGDDATSVAPGRPMFRKGQDFKALDTCLREILRQARHDESQPTIIPGRLEQG
jgi:DNA-binding response OmpR family regulator